MKKLKIFTFYWGVVLLFIMFIPFIVTAETCDADKITIESVTVDSILGNASDKKPVVNNKSVDLKLNMNYLKDSITYKIFIKNNSSEDFIVDKNSLKISSSEYVDYTLIIGNNSYSTIKANSTQPILLKVEYKKEVPEDKINNDIYNDSSDIAISLVSLSNPLTRIM